MHDNKKASAKAGQKLNHIHFRPLQPRFQHPDDYQKPSRKNRRQKRGWQRKRKCLTRFTSARHTCLTVLNTPHVAVSAPVSQSGFFTSIGFYRVLSFEETSIGQWPGSAQPYNSLRAKSASRLVAVLKYLAAPQQGVNSTNQLGAIMANTLKTRHAGNLLQTLHVLPIRLAVYRALRCICGPVLAYRLAFAAGVNHG